jgi:hypothetical protein
LTNCTVQYNTQIDVLNGANNVSISNCNITNSSGHGINVSSSSNFQAVNNTIANGSVNYHGIAISGGSNNMCYGNRIYKYSGSSGYRTGVGIVYSASSGPVTRNDIDYFSSGISATYGSTLNYSWSYGSDRNNRVTNCQIGVWAYSNSQCDFGKYVGGLDDGNGNNSIYGNTLYNVEIGNNINDPSKVYADDNWWGTNPPQGSKFDQWPYSSTFTYNHWWTTDHPWGGQPLPLVSGQATNSMGVKLTASTEQSINPESEGQNSFVAGGMQDSLVLGDRFKGKNTEAVQYLESYVANHPGDYAGYAALYGIADSARTPAIIDFFKSSQPSAPMIHGLLLANLYHMEGRPDLAEQQNNQIIAKNPNTSIAVMAALNNLRIALYCKNDVQSAKTFLNQIRKQSSLINPMELADAEHAIAMYVDPKTGSMPNADYQPSANSDQQVSDATVGDGGVMANYPNPFNPTTMITYKLLKGGHVIVKIFDAIGREVSTLVNETQEAGLHTMPFDGTRLASGIYFYDIAAPGIHQVKKMLLTR